MVIHSPSGREQASLFPTGVCTVTVVNLTFKIFLKYHLTDKTENATIYLKKI